MCSQMTGSKKSVGFKREAVRLLDRDRDMPHSIRFEVETEEQAKEEERWDLHPQKSYAKT